MDGEGQKESVQPKEQSESLKPFSDAQLLEELGKRLGGNPTVDPVIVQKLQSITTELQKKAEVAKPLQVEPEKPAEVIAQAEEVKPEVSTESEGKKWARIIREKGIGILEGKFNKNCKYYDASGKVQYFNPTGDIGFKFVGKFNSSNGKIPTDDIIFTYNKKIRERVADIYHGYYRARNANPHKDQANFLIIADTVEAESKLTKKLSSWLTFAYVSFLDPHSSPDPRGGVAITFYFALPREESSELVEALQKNVDVIEDVFQNVYPGLTSETEGMQRMAANKLRILPNTSFEDAGKRILKDVESLLKRDFSHPVGETPWNPMKRF